MARAKEKTRAKANKQKKRKKQYPSFHLSQQMWPVLLSTNLHLGGKLREKIKVGIHENTLRIGRGNRSQTHPGGSEFQGKQKITEVSTMASTKQINGQAGQGEGSEVKAFHDVDCGGFTWWLWVFAELWMFAFSLEDLQSRIKRSHISTVRYTMAFDLDVSELL